MLHKYDAVALGDRQLFPPYWEKGGQSKVLIFNGDTANKIKAIHAAKKWQQSILAAASNEVPKEVIPEEAKVKSKVRLLLLFSLVFYWYFRIVQGTGTPLMLHLS